VSEERNPAADWWCWTTNEPSTFRCRELGHDVRPRRPMPFERPVVDTLSTSARLRQVQADLAASQADLTRAERERDELRDVLNASIGTRAALADRALALKAELDAERDKRTEDIAAFGRACNELGEAMSILARIGDALSPTGERPQEALGTLAADVESYVAMHDVVEEDRDELLARLEAAYESLYIEEFDGDSCPDLEATIEYAIGAYRRVCDSESAAADQIKLLRAEVASARQENAQLRARFPEPDNQNGSSA
jgi:chromosome segregation ATPase